MVMADTSTTQLPRLRTYARDLESERQRRGMPSVPTPGKPSASTPTPVPKPTDTTVPTPSLATTETEPRSERVREQGEHIVVATPRPAHVSEAVRATREDELKKERENRPATIPPFHTLKAATRAATAAVVRETEVITIDNDESGATVITDTKHDRFNLRRSLFSSLRAWWQRRTRERKARKTPKYVVPETDRRKGVIQRATSHTGRQITGDRAQLQALVRERETKPAPTPEAETIWTPNTETMFALLPAPEGSDRFSKVTRTPRRGGGAVAIAPTPVPVIAPEPVTVAQSLPVEPPAAPPAPVLREPEEPEVVPQEPPEVTPPAAPEVATPVPAERSGRRFDTNTLSVGIVTMVVVVGLAAIGLRALLTPEPPAAVATIPLPVTIPLSSVPLSEGTRNALIQAITNAQAEATLPQQLLQFQNAAGAVTPSVLLTLLNPNLSPQLTGEASALYFGWHDRSIPFIVITVSDRTSVWGSLLAAEATLRTTFAPLLTTTGDRQFTDARVDHVDIRRYRSTEGAEELVYGFVNDHTLLITKNQATFLLIAALATEKQ